MPVLVLALLMMVQAPAVCQGPLPRGRGSVSNAVAEPRPQGRGIARGPAPEESFEALSREAEQARDADRLNEALALYKKALRLKPDWGEGWWTYGSIAYDRNQYGECASAFRRLTTLKSDDVPAWTMSGLCEYSLKNYDAALKSLLETERLGFKEIPDLARLARLHLALLLNRTGWFERAIVLINGAAPEDRKRPETMVACGIAGLRKPWLPFEVPEASRDLVYRLGDAMTEAMQLDPKATTEKFEAVARSYSDEPHVHFRFGAFLMQQNPDRGIEEIKQALKLDPAHLPSMVGLAMIYLKREDPQTALGYARDAVKTAPGDFTGHVALGRALLATEDAAGAARELEIAVKLASGSPEAHFSLASAYARLGRKADAARELAEFKRLKQNP